MIINLKESKQNDYSNIKESTQNNYNNIKESKQNDYSNLKEIVNKRCHVKFTWRLFVSELNLRLQPLGHRIYNIT